MSIISKTKARLNRMNFRRQKAEFRKMEKDDWMTVAREISPSVLDFKPDCIVCDKTLIKYIVVGVTRHGERGLPETLSNELLNDLMSVSMGNYTIGMTTAVVKVPNIEASHAIHSAEMSNLGNQFVERESNKSSYVSSDTRSDMKDINTKAEKIQSQTEVMFGLAFVLSILAETKDDMDLAVGHVSQILGAKLVRNEIPIGRMEEAMKTALPFPVMPRWIQDDPLSKQAAVFLAAQNVNPYSDKYGMRLGHKKGNISQQITVDLDALPAGHLLAVGQTGSGKTTAILVWLMRSITELHCNGVFITAKKDSGTDHRLVARSLGDDGTIIDIGPGQHSINPLHIVYDESQITDTPFGWASVVHRHIRLITRFFAVFLEDGMSAPKKSYINESVIRLYKNHGIHIDRPETLKVSLRNAKFPHMNDLIELWKKDQEMSGGSDRGKTISSMINNTFQMTSNGALSYINNDSDIDISNKKLIVVDVSAVDDDMREAMNVFVTGIIYQKFQTSNKDNNKTIIAIDEAREFLKNPTTRIDIIKQLTQARSDNVCMWFMTQQLSDIEKNDSKDEFKNNVFINVAFGPGGDSSKVDLVSSYYNFNEFEETAWVNCDQGEAMIMVHGDKIPVKIQLTPYELSVIKGTNLKASNKPTKLSAAIDNPIDKQVRKLVDENGVCVASWIPEEHNDVADDYFNTLKWMPVTCTSAIGAGRVKVWVRPGVVKNGKVGAQSSDHYFTVLQIAGYLSMNGIPKTSVHHTDNVDISAYIGERVVAFEFEKPRSHTSTELMEKQKRAEIEHDICYFVGTSENIAFLKSAVTKQNVIQRGANLKRLLDALVEETR